MHAPLQKHACLGQNLLLKFEMNIRKYINCKWFISTSNKTIISHDIMEPYFTTLEHINSAKL